MDPVARRSLQADGPYHNRLTFFYATDPRSPGRASDERGATARGNTGRPRWRGGRRRAARRKPARQQVKELRGDKQRSRSARRHLDNTLLSADPYRSQNRRSALHHREFSRGPLEDPEVGASSARSHRRRRAKAKTPKRSRVLPGRVCPGGIGSCKNKRRPRSSEEYTPGSIWGNGGGGCS